MTKRAATTTRSRRSHSATERGEVRVAVYLRISTDEDNQPFSLDAQEHRLRAFIESQPGWALARTPYVDQMSGAYIDRPQLQRALRDASLGLFDVLLVYRVDRFARKLSVLVDLLEQLEGSGVAFRSATEPIDTSTPTGRMLVQLLGVFAEFERETIIDRVINGMERKAARGEWTAGNRPFGYTTAKRARDDNSPNYLIVDEQCAPLVPVIFDLYARKRMGAHAIAHWLNDNGHRTQRGRLWSHVAVLKVLRNRTYLGEIFFRDTWHPAPHRPLVAEALFGEAQRLLDERGEDYSKRAANVSDYLLSGLVTCAKCGQHYTGTAATGRSARYRYYTCFSRQRYGVKKCDADRLPADELDAAILGALLATYRRHDLFDQAVRAAAARVDDSRGLHTAELAAADAKIAKVEGSIERYLRAFEGGTMPEAQCGDRVRELGKELSELRLRRDQLAELVDDSVAVPPSEEVLAEVRKRVAEAIERGSDAERKALLQALVANVCVTNREHIEPYFRVPQTSATAVRAVEALVDTRVSLSNPPLLFQRLAELEIRGGAQPPRRSRQHQCRLTSAQIDQLVAAYRDGASTYALAEQFGLHRSTVVAHLERAGVAQRQRGVPLDAHADVTARYEAGQTLEQLAKRFDVDTDTIRRLLVLAGVSIRPRGRRRKES